MGKRKSTTETTRESASHAGGAGPRVILRPKNLAPGLQPEYVIDRFPATIGRHPINDIELGFESISRYHARFELREGKARLVDLHSSNGTFVNGKRVEIAALVDHDSVAFGSIDFTLILNEQAAPGGPEGAPAEPLAVQFEMREDPLEMVFHTELAGDTSHANVLQSEITDEMQLKQAKQRLVSLYRLQEVLRSTTDEETLLRSVLNLMFDVLPVDRGVVLTRDEQDPAVFRPIAIRAKTAAGREKIGISKTILQRCLREKVAILTRDATRDERFKEAESIFANRMRSVMCVPLLSAHHIFGFLHLDTTDAVRLFTEGDLTFLANVGQEVAIHLHNLRMLHEKIATERVAAIGQTITGMAHNVKNILVLSQGGIEMMEKQLHEKNYDALDETWGLVRRGVDRINRLVQDMLDYSKARTVQKRKIRIDEFLQELIETFSEAMIKQGIDCRLELDESSPALTLDADGLEKALVNLIVNAMEACGDATGGEIRLRAMMDAESRLILQVEDNAGGIPKEILPRIFVPFFTTKGSRGSGLGLAMTRKIVEDLGGHIEVKSTEGAGTCFTIILYTGPSTPRLGEALKV